MSNIVEKAVNRIHSLCGAIAVALVLACPAGAAVIHDPANDFLPTYPGAHGGDLDVTSVHVTFDGTNFVLDSVLNGNVGTTPTGFYVWGVNRGAGTSRFGIISANGHTYDASAVLFDSVITLRPNGASAVNELVGGVSHPLPASNVSFHDNELMAIIPASFLPSKGFTFEQYGFNLWPRDSAVPAGNAQISDFAPNNAMFVASVVPEPSSLALFALGGIVAWGGTRRSMRRAAA